jgi:hypothetical protein
MTALRVRQVVIAVGGIERRAADAVAAGLPFVHRDPGVGAFGAANSLHAAGDTFVELLAERDPGSAVGRHLQRLGGDGGYMVIVQVDDLDAHLARVAALGVRVVWSGAVEGVRGAHLHPADVGGAILSLDQADPPEAWPWCGPAWTGSAGPVEGEPITAIEVSAGDPPAAAARWAAVLATAASGATVELPGTTIDFVPRDDRPDRLVAITVPGIAEQSLGGVRLRS